MSDLSLTAFPDGPGHRLHPRARARRWRRHVARLRRDRRGARAQGRGQGAAGRDGGHVSLERFKREIALAARLQHPHIVPLLTAGEADGLPYFTMPFVEGESLRARLARDGELPVSEAVRMLREVATRARVRARARRRPPRHQAGQRAARRAAARWSPTSASPKRCRGVEHGGRRRR